MEFNYRIQLWSPFVKCGKTTFITANSSQATVKNCQIWVLLNRLLAWFRESFNFSKKRNTRVLLALSGQDEQNRLFKLSYF